MTRDEMIAYIADEWVDGLDFKDLIRAKVYEYTQELEGWTDKDILEEYKSMTEL